jgi:hypothetical protein
MGHPPYDSYPGHPSNRIFSPMQCANMRRAVLEEEHDDVMPCINQIPGYRRGRFAVIRGRLEPGRASRRSKMNRRFVLVVVAGTKPKAFCVTSHKLGRLLAATARS